MCVLIDCILDRRDMFTLFSVDNHCIPHRAPLASQLLKLTQKVAKQDFERICVGRRVESSVDERCDVESFVDEGFSLRNASGDGIGVPAGRPT